MTRLVQIAGALLTLVIVSGCMSAAERDERLVGLLQTEKQKGAAGEGLVIVDATVNGHPCNLTSLDVVRDDGGSLGNSVRIRASAQSLGFFPAGLKALKAGEYQVVRVSCRTGNHTDNYNGPFASFVVNAGEVVDVGQLDIAYKSDGFFSSSGNMTRTVRPIADRVMANLRERNPNTLEGMLKRPMKILGPSESKARTGGFF